MRNPRIQLLTIILAFVMVLGAGCYNDYVIFPEGATVTGDVFFATDVQPIFNAKCNTSGCHSSGGQKPDLSIGNAYNSLTNGQYYDVASPESSVIYLWMHGDKTISMPPTGSDPNATQEVLAWIKQGALNN